jgi:hypothetical protein
MAKRQRTRPGQRTPARPSRPASGSAAQRPAQTRPVGSLSESEELRAAELEAQIVAEERAAETARSVGRDRGRDRRRDATVAGPGVRPAVGSLVAARGVVEYEYVRRDVLRIVRVGGALLVLLAVLFVLIDIVGVIKL